MAFESIATTSTSPPGSRPNAARRGDERFGFVVDVALQRATA